jgi:Tfp pilus assembly protein FimT
MFRVVAVVAVLTVMAALLAAPSFAAPAEGASGRYLVRARSAADLGALRAKAVADGAKVVQTIPRSTPWWSGRRRRPGAGWPPTAGPRAWPPTA